MGGGWWLEAREEDTLGVVDCAAAGEREIDPINYIHLNEQ